MDKYVEAMTANVLALGDLVEELKKVHVVAQEQLEVISTAYRGNEKLTRQWIAATAANDSDLDEQGLPSSEEL